MLASESGLSVSIDSARASFSRSRSIKSAMRRRKRDRSTAGVRNQSENLLCYGDSKINVARVAVRDLRIRFASRRLDVVEILAAYRFGKLPVDKIADSLKLCVHEIRKKLSFVAARATDR